MKETIKASIGAYAFTLDVDAYEALNNYLDDLKRHFQKKADSREIISDIEDRMRELLHMKQIKPDDILTLADAKDIISIMGNPKDFDETEETESQPVEQLASSPSIQKRIYRDPNNALLGGVLSGLGIYFRLDPVIIRVVYILSVILSKPISGKISVLLFLAYFVMWAIVPAAKTISQKLALTGQDPSIEAIESRTAKAYKNRGLGLGRFIVRFVKICLGLMLYLIGLCFVIPTVLFVVLPGTFNFPPLREILYVFAGYNVDSIVWFAILWLIPAVCAIYFGVKIMFKITARDWIFLAVAFTIWILIAVYLTAVSVGLFRVYANEEVTTEVVAPLIQSDTLYVKMADEYKTAFPISDAYSIGEKSSRRKNDNRSDLYEMRGEMRSWFVRPEIRIDKDSAYTEFKIEIKKKVFDETEYLAEQKAEKAKLNYTVRDSLLTITPRLYNKNNVWDREIFDLVIQCPADKTVVLWK